jgi:fructokinase
MRLGIDLGGTKIEAVLLDDSGQIKARRRIPTRQDDYAAILKDIVALVTDLELGLVNFDEKISVGIGMPGAISPQTGLIKNSNNTCLNGKPVRQDLGAALDREIAIANDADCFTLSEAIDGAASGAEVVFGVILGTGVGGGICVNGRLLNGVNAIAGEWGHNPLPLTDRELGNIKSLSKTRRCGCGKVNCIETWLSGGAFELSYREASGDSFAAQDIVKLAQVEDTIAGEILEQYSRMLALALSTVINVIDPEVIVLGGGMSNVDALYTRVPEIWSEYVFSDQVETRLVKASYGDSSGVRGAAWLQDTGWGNPGLR